MSMTSADRTKERARLRAAFCAAGFQVTLAAGLTVQDPATGRGLATVAPLGRTGAYYVRRVQAPVAERGTRCRTLAAAIAAVRALQPSSPSSPSQPQLAVPRRPR